MIKHLSALELGGLAARGASLEVDGSQFATPDLQSIAARLIAGATLKVHNSKSKSATDLGSIAARKPGQVILA